MGKNRDSSSDSRSPSSERRNSDKKHRSKRTRQQKKSRSQSPKKNTQKIESNQTPEIIVTRRVGQKSNTDVNNEEIGQQTKVLIPALQQEPGYLTLKYNELHNKEYKLRMDHENIEPKPQPTDGNFSQFNKIESAESQAQIPDAAPSPKPMPEVQTISSGGFQVPTSKPRSGQAPVGASLPVVPIEPIEPRATHGTSATINPQFSGRSGGVYIPPHKLRALQEELMRSQKHTEEHQRLMWEMLRKSINGVINKVNVVNIQHVLIELLNENILRAKGLLARAIIKAQMASPNFTHVYAALTGVINTKLPEIAYLIIKRVILQFRRAYQRNNKIVCMATTKLIAH
jgi:hypothetical protein